MKVLRKGKAKNHKWIGECHFCLAIVQTDTKELRKSGQLRSEEDPLIWLDCPECYCKNSLCFSREDTGAAIKIMEKVSDGKR